MKLLLRIGRWLSNQRRRWFGPRQTPPIYPLNGGRPAIWNTGSSHQTQRAASRDWYDTRTAEAQTPTGSHASDSVSPTGSHGAPLASSGPSVTLRLGRPLGRPGGQGAVFELPDHPGMVYKQYKRPLRRAARAFDDLLTAGQELAPMLEGTGLTVLWPAQICGSHDVVEGYIMPRMPDRFRLELTSPKYGISLREASLDFALTPDERVVFARRKVSVPERIQILRLVGSFLDTLHSNDYVYGDISWKNLLFAVDPIEVLVMDIDGVHHIYAEVIRGKDQVHTLDWQDPFGNYALGFDLDRYRFGLLVYRMLVVDDISKGFPQGGRLIDVPHRDGFSSSQRNALEFLCRRAAGPKGTRPPIREWLSALKPAQ